MNWNGGFTGENIGTVGPGREKPVHRHFNIARQRMPPADDGERQR